MTTRVGRQATSTQRRERVAHVSEEMRRLHGLDDEAGETSLAAILDRVHPDDRGDVQAVVDGLAACGQESVFEYRVRWPDGTERIIQGRGRGVTEPTWPAKPPS